MSKSKANWPLGLSLGDLDAERVPKPAKRPGDTKSPGGPKPAQPANRPVAAEAGSDPTAQPTVKRPVAPSHWLLTQTAFVPEA